MSVARVIVPGGAALTCIRAPLIERIDYKSPDSAPGVNAMIIGRLNLEVLRRYVLEFAVCGKASTLPQLQGEIYGLLQRQLLVSTP